MKNYEKNRLKRMALGMDIEEFAKIGKRDPEFVERYENGEYIPKKERDKFDWNVEKYIRAFDRERYLQTRIIYETMLMQHEPKEEHAKTLSHMMIHVAKLNMMYVANCDEYVMY